MNNKFFKNLISNFISQKIRRMIFNLKSYINIFLINIFKKKSLKFIALNLKLYQTDLTLQRIQTEIIS